MSENVVDLTKLIVKNAINTISDTEAEYAELKMKYDKLLTFVKRIKTHGCDLIGDCRACDALDVLSDINES